MRKDLLVFLFCLFLLWNLVTPVCAAGRLKVGVHDNQPLAFVDADGQAKGFLIDILGVAPRVYSRFFASMS